MKKLNLFLIVLLLWSCGDNEAERCAFSPGISTEDFPLSLEQFEDTLAIIQSKKALAAFLTRQPLIRDQMLRRAEYPNDSVFLDEMFRRFSNPAIDALLIETRLTFGDLSELKSQF